MNNHKKIQKQLPQKKSDPWATVRAVLMFGAGGTLSATGAALIWMINNDKIQDPETLDTATTFSVPLVSFGIAIVALYGLKKLADYQSRSVNYIKRGPAKKQKTR